MRGKSYNAPELIQEDLLCFFRFSRRGVELVGDLDERMGKAEMLRLMEEEATAGSSGLPAPSKKATKKRRVSTPTEKEARREKRKKKEEEVPDTEARGTSTSKTRRDASSLKEPEGHLDPMQSIDIPEASPEKEGPTERAGPGEAGNLRRSFDDATEHYSKLEKRLAEMEAARAEETRAAEMHKAALETRGLRLEAERAGLMSEKRALEGEKMALEGERAAMKAELDETNA
ncbi:WEB family protein-like [Dorcoceras hygrometricum]|uniref:WEB family protein-like n=1 Tax=Dorcoceras hygrometricum TaxID=472368 RepID=A0A2Z7D2G7_9LAMI|nr:WEB family protein-like [Dorcoceras hygrometricum]